MPFDVATAKRFWSKVKKTSACWLWQGARDHGGYGWFWLNGAARKAHRVSYEGEFGAIPPDRLVCHHCDEPSCVRPTHFFLGTVQDNMDDAARKGRLNKPRGERVGTAKLTTDQVRAIKRLLRDGTSQAQIARRFGVAFSTIWWIAHGHTWAHVA